MRRLDSRFALVLLLVIAVLAGAAHLLHGFQVRRNARFLLEQALVQQRQGDERASSGFFRRYLNLVPEDNDARAQWGLLLADTPGAEAQAIATLRDVVRSEPTRIKEGRRLVELQVRAGQFAQAEQRCRNLLKRDVSAAGGGSGDPLVHSLLGQCLVELRKPVEAREQFDMAKQAYRKQRSGGAQADAQSDDLLVYLRLARLLQKDLADPIASELELASLVADHPNQHLPLQLRARYRLELASEMPSATQANAEIDLADADLVEARKLAPREPNVLYLSAQIALLKKKADDARGFLKQGIRVAPLSPRWYQALAQIEFEAGRSRAAVAALRQGVTAISSDLELRSSLAEMLIETGDTKEAGQAIERLKEQGLPAPRLDYLRARVLVANREWRKGAQLLEAIDDELARWPNIGRTVSFWLGECYRRLGRRQEQQDAYQRALTADPTSIPAMVALASTLATTGLVDDEQRAVALYQQALDRSQDRPELALPLIRLLVRQQLRQPPGQRRWTEIESRVQRTADQLPPSPEMAVLRAEVLSVQGEAAGLDAAQGLLTAAREQWPKELQLWTAQAALLAQRNDWVAAERLLDEVQSNLGDSAELRLARVRQVLMRYGTDAADHLAALEVGIGALSDSDRLRVQDALATGYEAAGNAASARRLLTAVAKARPADLGVRLRLMNLEVSQGKLNALRKVLDEVKSFDHPDAQAAWWYGEAARLVELARQGETGQLGRARELLSNAHAARPAWASVVLLQAEIQLLEKNNSAAIERYSEAVLRMQVRRPPVIRRLVELLIETGRFNDAQAVLDLLQDDPSGISPELERGQVEILLGTNRLRQALELIRKIAAGSNDYRDQLWHGHVASRAGEAQEAEEALRLAVRNAPDKPDALLALVYWLTRQQRADEAATEAESARQKLPESIRARTLALCYDLLGRQEEAAQEFQAALDAAPKDLEVRRSAAEFYLRHGKSDQAEMLLRQTLRTKENVPKTDRAWARRNLAMVLVDLRRPQWYSRAQDLIEENLRGDSESVEDLRAKAVILATRRRSHLQAIDIYRRLADRGDVALGAADRLLLAGLYQSQRQWAAAQQELLVLLGSERDNPVYLTEMANSCMVGGQISEARGWIDRLLVVSPASLRAKELEARWLALNGQAAEAIAVVDSLLVNPTPNTAAQGAKPNQSTVGSILETIASALRTAAADVADPADNAAEGNTDGPPRGDPAKKDRLLGSAAELLRAAEQRYRDFVRDQPGRFLVLADFLARQGQTEEALELYARAWPDNPESAALGSVAALRVGKDGQRHVNQVEAALQAALKRSGNSTVLLLALADLSDYRKSYDRAQDFYRQVLKKDPKNPVALNNLALLLALREEGGRQPLKLISQAMKDAGDSALLLDSRGSIYSAQGRHDDAVRDLEMSLADEPAAATWFHLAVAHHRWQNRSAWYNAFDQAIAAGLRESDLHPLELKDFRQLREERRPRAEVSAKPGRGR